MAETEKSVSGFQQFHTPDNLKKFMNDYDLLLDIDNEQCRYLIENLNKEGMQLGIDTKDGKLKILCDNEASISEITIDEAIDIACDVAYDKVAGVNQKISETTDKEKRVQALEDAVTALKESAMLDKLYVQTIYFKQSVVAEALHQDNGKNMQINMAARNRKKR